MENERMVECSTCGKIVPEEQIDRDGDCISCRAVDKASDMGVGDINSR